MANDSIYRMAMNNFRRQWEQANVLATGGREQNRLNRDLAMRPYSDDNKRAAGDELFSEAAGRGMLQSSTTGNNYNDFVKQWQQKIDEIGRSRSQANWGIDNAQRTTKQNIQSQREQALFDLQQRRNAARGL